MTTSPAFEPVRARDAASRGETRRGCGSPPSTGAPSRLSRFMRAKYIGGSGCPSRMWETNASSPLSAAAIAGLKRRSYPTVVSGTAPSAFPHEEPAPWAGHTCR